jgi:hypothetical protein
VSSNTWAVPSSTYVIPSSVPSAPPAYSTPVESAPASYPHGSWGVPSETYPVGPASSSEAGYTSICTESTTQIWRSSTAVVPVTITHSAPAGGWTTYPAGNATAPASATGGWGATGSYSGPIATNAAAKVGAGVAAIGGVLAAALL